MISKNQNTFLFRSVLQNNSEQNSTQENKNVHREMFEVNPVQYALYAILPEVNTLQRSYFLAQLLSASWKNLEAKDKNILHRVLAILIQIIPADKVLNTLIDLRNEKVNRKHLTRTILNFIFKHPELSELIRFRRQGVQSVLEHALGKSTARTIALLLKEEKTGVLSAIKGIQSPSFGADTIVKNQYLQQNLFRLFNGKLELLKQFYPKVYQTSKEKGVPSRYKKIHQKAINRIFSKKKYAKVLNATNRGKIAANLAHIYRGGTSSLLEEAIEKEVIACCQSLPTVNAKVALILDASISVEGIGERAYTLSSQSFAFSKVLAQQCSELKTFLVGGTGKFLKPEGATDLALALIAALETNPELVLIVSDGYENTNEGDLAKVVNSLAQIDIETPILFCHSKFSGEDDLTNRRPAPMLPEVEFWHQDDFEQILIYMLAILENDQAQQKLTDYLLKNLEKIEQKTQITILKK